MSIKTKNEKKLKSQSYLEDNRGIKMSLERKNEERQ